MCVTHVLCGYCITAPAQSHVTRYRVYGATPWPLPPTLLPLPNRTRLMLSRRPCLDLASLIIRGCAHLSGHPSVHQSAFDVYLHLTIIHTLWLSTLDDYSPLSALTIICTWWLSTLIIIHTWRLSTLDNYPHLMTICTLWLSTHDYPHMTVIHSIIRTWWLSARKRYGGTNRWTNGPTDRQTLLVSLVRD